MNNPHNVLITKKDVENILNYFGPIGEIDKNGNSTLLKINNLEYYQESFVHESYFQYVQNYIQQNSKSDNESLMQNYPIYINYVPKRSNEVLEFLGDNVLKTCIGNYIFQRYAGQREGFMTKLKIKIEKSSTLYKFAISLGFKKFLLLSLQVENQTILERFRGRNTISFYEDAFESFIGAIMQDFGEMGFIYAERFVRNIIENTIDFSELINTNDNYKDGLQRFFQFLKFKVPVYYTINEEGPLYRKVFTRILYITKEQFEQLNEIQKLNIENYTNNCLKYYKIHSQCIYKLLFNKITDENLFILSIGKGQKVILAEQACAKSGLEILELELNY